MMCSSAMERPRFVTPVAVALATALTMAAGCGGSGAAGPEGPPAASVGAGDEGAEPEPAEAESGEPELTAAQKMGNHFGDVMEARDAVIAGNVAGMKPPLARIGAGEYGLEVPGSWAGSLDELSSLARNGADVSTVREAAVLVAEVSHTCADCHRTFRGGPKVPLDRVGGPDHDTGPKDVMARHVWAADELWLGLTAPHLDAWRRGAEALAPTTAAPVAEAAPEAASAPEPASQEDARLQAELASLADWSGRALEAHTPGKRRRLYAELLGRCASCHAEHGVKLEL